MKLKDFDFIERTSERYSSVEKFIIPKKEKLPVAVEDKNLIEDRLDHLSAFRFEPFDLALERIIGENDLMSINYLQIGYMSSYPVCRLHIRNGQGGNEGYGTGFLVSPSLLLTNNHVFKDASFASNSLAEFNYQYDVNGLPAKSYMFEFDPERFFFTNPGLDYSLVAIKHLSIDGTKSLSDFGFLKLFESTGKALLSENLSIIQHPGAGYKQVALRENKLISSPPDSDFITYSTDTTQGSSGAPVFNDQWQVVALHHSGVPRKDNNGQILCKNGKPWEKGMDENQIDWISNEGVRISAIVRNLTKEMPDNDLIKEMLNVKGSVVNLPDRSSEKLSLNSVEDNKINQKIENNMENKVTLTIPIEVSFSIGSGMTPVVKSEPKPGAPTELRYEVAKADDANYTGRNGYDPDFLNSNQIAVELKDILGQKLDDLAPLKSPSDKNKYFLHYYNFSVVINKYRKLCTLTAVNIDGSKSETITRENTKWILDPRMDEKYQTGPKVYADNDLDRGHMVRRLDPVWGPHAQAANDDTFHFTNSTPQHKNLNQKTWLSLEDYILENADSANLKVSVFTGPVFSQDDIPYRGVLLPLEFWKIAVMIKSDGTPSVTGYMLKQPDEIEDFRYYEGIREDGYGQFRTYQVPIRKISKLTGLNFDLYENFDPLAGVDFTETSKLIEIVGPKDIRI